MEGRSMSVQRDRATGSYGCLVRVPRSIPERLGTRSSSLPGDKGVRVVPEVSRQVEALAEQMLCEAYELVLSGWCQETDAQDELGRAIEPSSAFARRWSAVGALERVWRRIPGGDDLAIEAFERANLALAGVVRDVPRRWNDHGDRTQDEVLEALDNARLLLRPPDRAEAALAEDLLDDLERYEAIPGHVFESSASPEV
jgi:hypothetical protein